MQSGEIIWEPDPSVAAVSTLADYGRFVRAQYSLPAMEYAELHEWSIANLDTFWESVMTYFGVWTDAPFTSVLDDRKMPSASWFPGATLNYAEQILRHTGSGTAITARSESRPDVEWSWDDLRDQVARIRTGMRATGIQPGDRVVAYMPNIPETVAAYLATASLGAVWSSCAPEFGVQSVVDRFKQIEPKLLLTISAYQYGGVTLSRADEVDELRRSLPSIEHAIDVPYLENSDQPAGSVSWAEFTAQKEELSFLPVAFGHPLAVLFSSGTTGLPKAIVHGHGGVLLEHLKLLGLQLNIQRSDRFFWYSSTGWMMWNVLVSGLAVGASIVLFDGSPAYPTMNRLWEIAAETRTTFLGLSAGYILECRRRGLTPGSDHDLSRIWGIGSTASPLPVEGYEWIHHEVSSNAQVIAASGGTDVLSAFIGGAPNVPVYAGEMSCAALGVDIEAFDANGEAVRGAQGELVIRAPMPSMPVSFWGDPDGSRLRDAYFDMYPGVWRHGDWLTITDRDTFILSGRSDATLNRGGVRLGTGEFYSVVENIPGIEDSLVIHLDGDADTPAGRLVLFVSLKSGMELTPDLVAKVRRQLRTSLSPRHVPDQVIAVSEVPYTLSGKKLEVPVKRILQGEERHELIVEGALRNPQVLDEYAAHADTLAGALPT